MGTLGCLRAQSYFLLLIVSCLVCDADALRFLFLPFMGGNSPSMDLMGVAAALQAR